MTPVTLEATGGGLIAVAGPSNIVAELPNCPAPVHPQLNHRVVLDAMLAAAGVPAAKFRTICSSIDKLDKAEWVRCARRRTHAGPSNAGLVLTRNVAAGVRRVRCVHGRRPRCATRWCTRRA